MDPRKEKSEPIFTFSDSQNGGSFKTKIQVSLRLSLVLFLFCLVFLLFFMR